MIPRAKISLDKAISFQLNIRSAANTGNVPAPIGIESAEPIKSPADLNYEWI